MADVDANKVLSDPRKVARLYYVLEPMLTKPIQFKAKTKRCNSILNASLEMVNDYHVTAALKSYRIVNETIYHKLSRVDSEGIATIFTTSKSIDPSSSPVCMALLSEHVVLGDKLLELETSLYKEFGPSQKQIMYFPVAPVFFPVVTAYEDKKVMFKFPFPEIFEEINKKLTGKGIHDLNLERRLDQDIEGEKGIYRFKTLLFEPGPAKDVFVERLDRTPEDINEQRRQIEDCTYINRTLMGNAFSNICRKLGIQPPIPLYSEDGGYAARIFEDSGMDFTTFSQVTRNNSGKINLQKGLSAKSPLDILKSYIHHVRYG